MRSHSSISFRSPPWNPGVCCEEKNDTSGSPEIHYTQLCSKGFFHKTRKLLMKNSTIVDSTGLELKLRGGRRHTQQEHRVVMVNKSGTHQVFAPKENSLNMYHFRLRNPAFEVRRVSTVRNSLRSVNVEILEGREVAMHFLLVRFTSSIHFRISGLLKPSLPSLLYLELRIWKIQANAIWGELWVHSRHQPWG